MDIISSFSELFFYNYIWKFKFSKYFLFFIIKKLDIISTFGYNCLKIIFYEVYIC